MNCIIVVRGLDNLEYNDFCHNLKSQFEGRKIDPPFFARLPLIPDVPQIEVVWIDSEMELENLENMLKQAAGGHSTDDPQ